MTSDGTRRPGNPSALEPEPLIRWSGATLVAAGFGPECEHGWFDTLAHWVDHDLVSARRRQRDVSEVDSERHHHQLAWIECRRRMFDLEPAGDLGESLLGFAYAGAKEDSTRTAGTPKVEDPGGWDSMTGGDEPHR